jgi:hypothetical protein
MGKVKQRALIENVFGIVVEANQDAPIIWSEQLVFVPIRGQVAAYLF